MDKYIDWNEISRRGLLVRINREIMHPLGLAVARDPATGQSPGALCSADGEGFMFAGEDCAQPTPVEALRALLKLYEDDEGCRALPGYRNARRAVDLADQAMKLGDFVHWVEN